MDEEDCPPVLETRVFTDQNGEFYYGDVVSHNGNIYVATACGGTINAPGEPTDEWRLVSGPLCDSDTGVIFADAPPHEMGCCPTTLPSECTGVVEFCPEPEPEPLPEPEPEVVQQWGANRAVIGIPSAML